MALTSFPRLRCVIIDVAVNVCERTTMNCKITRVRKRHRVLVDSRPSKDLQGGEDAGIAKD